jgi:4-phosphopantoate---beta-alanine ligase
MRLSPRHPRYESLKVRHRLAKAHERGLVVPEGLIAHGRGEAFDYFLGERTTPSARRAERVAAEWLLAAEHPVVSVNGNVAALAAAEVAALARAVPGLSVEVNLFHRSGPRARQVAAALRAAGIDRVLGVRPTATLPGLPSDRAKVDRTGIFAADVCLVPLEDGDRAEALRALDKRVISIDLNPLSRTSQAADLPIVDEIVRALREIARVAGGLRRSGSPAELRPFDRYGALGDALATIDRNLNRAAARRRRPGPPGRASLRRPRGTGGRSHRTP